jgi:hypothetical protein
VFATMRRKRRNATVKQELGQSVDHFKRAATLAAQETTATVGPKLNAAKDRVQPVADKAKGSASGGWESAVATLAPLIAAATESMRQTSKTSAEVNKQTAKANKKNAKKLEKQADKMLGRKQSGRRTGRLFGFALVGAAIGGGAALVMKRRKAQQWDEYDPGATVTPIRQAGADDAAFEPAETATIEPVGTTATRTPGSTTSAGTAPSGTATGSTTPGSTTQGGATTSARTGGDTNKAGTTPGSTNKAGTTSTDTTKD